MTQNKKVLKKIQGLCQKFYDDLQEIYDEETDEDTYEHEICQLATAAQAYAGDCTEETI